MEEKSPKYNSPTMKLHLGIFNSVGRFKSIRRAIKRGHVTLWGEEIPKRPFNNKKRTPGRKLQLNKEKIYGELKHRNQQSWPQGF